jgi:hypothetical protein
MGTALVVAITVIGIIGLLVFIVNEYRKLK